ncbi:hypothetical protein [Psychrobacter aquimaris]|uniref:hypothetical protein n=1 Tax=Psychrobacter aquimaris TaxID=292733 RepID=UPI001D1024F1|nr:hypothetical protein [Psychrobacter aquimaris]
MKKSLQSILNRVGLTALVAASLLSSTVQAADSDDRLKSTIDQQATLLMNKHDIPGMAFGIIIDGKSHFYHYGLADKNEPPRLYRRLIYLSQAAMPDRIKLS